MKSITGIVTLRPRFKQVCAGLRWVCRRRPASRDAIAVRIRTNWKKTMNRRYYAEFPSLRSFGDLPDVNLVLICSHNCQMMIIRLYNQRPWTTPEWISLSFLHSQSMAVYERNISISSWLDACLLPSTRVISGAVRDAVLPYFSSTRGVSICNLCVSVNDISPFVIISFSIGERMFLKF